MMRAGGVGEVALVLHTHLPYVRNHGVWPVGEEWLFQAWAESWLPLTALLLGLADAGRRDVLTLSVSPTTAHQVADERLRADVATWIACQMWQSEEQRTLYDGPHRDAIRGLGPFHWRRHAELLAVHERIEDRGGLLAVWAELAAGGVIELLGGPATHPYLALTEDPDLVDAQLGAGLASQATWAGRAPAGLWSPECSYRPAGPVADPTARPLYVDGDGTPTLPRPGPDRAGLETHYARHGISHVVTDAATVVRAAGGQRDWTHRPETPDPATGDPYETVHDGVLIGDSDVVAFARDVAVAYHVWSPTAGYPGDPWYRDFHARGWFGAHPSWRVTDKTLPADRKAPYEPDRAQARVASHADHFHGVLRETLDPRPGALVVAAYDTELFGHWWLEGPEWLEAILDRIDADPRLRTTTLASRLERQPPTRRLRLPESSWGYAKGHASWVTEDTRWLWSALRRIEQRFARLVRERDDMPADALGQAARELALAQSSDWAFMLTRGDCPGYAAERFKGHVERFDDLADALERGTVPVDAVTTYADLDDAPADPSAFLASLVASGA